MTQFNLLLLVTFLPPCLLVLRCLKRRGGILDIGVVIGTLLVFLYVVVPWLALMEKTELNRLIRDEFIRDYMLLTLASVTALVLGLWPRKIRADPRAVNLGNIGTIRILAHVIGGVAMLSYYLLVFNAGGFGAVYGSSYGLPWSDSGYVREAVLLSITSAGLIIHYMRLVPSRAARLRSLLILTLVLSPLLVHGILGARRGFIFMYFAAQYLAIVGSGMIRPRLLTSAAIGVFVGLLMLAAVANRGNFYLGGSWQLENSPLKILEVRRGNEFVFGTALTYYVNETDRHYDGARVLAIAFIRPIPSAIWPTKYADIARWFDIPNFQRDGLFVTDQAFERVLGWRPESGAAPGMVADFYLEFGWLGVLVLFLLGRVMRVVSDKARADPQSMLVPLEMVLICLSVYLVMQSIEAFLFRVLFLGLPAVALYWLFVGRRRQRQRAPVTA